MTQKIIIVVQNLKIGGFQRIALDEAYGFSAKKIDTTLVLLEDTESDSFNSFVKSESDLISKYNLVIKSASGSRFNQFLFFRSMLRSLGGATQVISHSLRATVIIWFAKFVSRNDIRVHTVIHQLPSLSAPVQRFKRFIYSLFSDKLYTFSIAAKNDWDNKIQSNLLLKSVFQKKPIILLRNGVFLERLPVKSYGHLADGTLNIRLIFLGRPTKWKGVDTVLELLKTKRLISATAIFYFPYENSQLMSNIPTQIQDRITVYFGKTIRDYSPRIGDVHVYPVNYGNRGEFIESISINCLEMMALGIPSCVTKGGLDTWPELSKNSMITEVIWSNLDQTAEKIFETHMRVHENSDFISARRIVSIDGHIDQLVQIAKK